MRGPRTAMKSGPHLLQLEKALTQKRRPNIAKKKKKIKGPTLFTNLLCLLYLLTLGDLNTSLLLVYGPDPVRVNFPSHFLLTQRPQIPSDALGPLDSPLIPNLLGTGCPSFQSMRYSLGIPEASFSPPQKPFTAHSCSK